LLPKPLMAIPGILEIARNCKPMSGRPEKLRDRIAERRYASPTLTLALNNVNSR
jgi:hypothetical protein